MANEQENALIRLVRKYKGRVETQNLMSMPMQIRHHFSFEEKDFAFMLRDLYNIDLNKKLEPKETVIPPGYVQLPRSVEEAEGMLLVAKAYLDVHKKTD